MKKTQRVFLLFSALYFGFILSLGAWWLHLIVKFGEQVDALGGQVNGPSISKMVKWEGATFFTVLILLSISFVILYLKDQKKTKGLQAFFASMTHELKTPLASIRLQAEVLHETIQNAEGLENKKLEKFSNRLIEDSNKLETRMDKILQLSRLEGGGDLHLEELDLKDQIQRAISRWSSHQEITVNNFEEQRILGDAFALDLILRNLLENTKVHGESTPAQITVNAGKDPNYVILEYTDGGVFKGEVKKLTQIFYRHNSHKGSGIGLYLIEGLMKKMSGQFKITLLDDRSLKFSLFFPRVRS